MTRPLIHPRMMRSIPNMFQTELRIQSSTETPNVYTRELERVWTNVAGMTAIRAHVESISDFTQSRLPEHYKEYVTHILHLQIQTDEIGDGYRAIDNDTGYVYNVRGTDTDSQLSHTTLYCEEVSL